MAKKTIFFLRKVGGVRQGRDPLMGTPRISNRKLPVGSSLEETSCKQLIYRKLPIGSLLSEASYKKLPYRKLPVGSFLYEASCKKLPRPIYFGTDSNTDGVVVFYQKKEY